MVNGKLAPGKDFSTNLPVKNHAQQTGNVSQREITKEKWER
jgi:hypothetical protein